MKEISLTKGLVALVDDDDFERIAHLRWHAQGPMRTQGFYAVHGSWTGSRCKTIYMHRLILQPESHQLIDHIDGNGLNNQRDNLRVCTQSQNMGNRKKSANTSAPYKGITKIGFRWRAQIFSQGKYYSAGMYDTPEEAARARDAAAIKHHGEFARLNFPQG